MTYFLLEPEVAGELGPHTEMDTSVHPPRVHRLHYEITDWLGDELLESFPCFLISRRLGERAAAEGLTGFELADVEVTLSPEAEELLGDVQLPEFRWLKVTGVAGSADFGLTAKAQLVVSERALDVLREGSLENCDVEEFTGE
ncbi:hypothetical protein C3Y87_11110 [Carbonactinospora thermoautotrophica]|uniref:hypothetical protein n=1 Tax=Carbonactinospora thermoautotrophica TaxID=1469144 RepID=UPI00226ED671|nr:hypothetical protein [Carbonactinospora thermoautotrophica]MCX9191955.1 hypothetical protein [Carbonactinospora thermoautotrophica]